MGQCQLAELLRGAMHPSRFGRRAVGGHLSQLSSGAVSVAGLCCWCLLCSKAGYSFCSLPWQEQASGVLPWLGEKRGRRVMGSSGTLRYASQD